MAHTKEISVDISLQRSQAVGLIVAIIVMNFFDAAATWSCLSERLCKELNPLMQLAYDGGPAVFFGIKTLILLPVLFCLDYIHEKLPRRLLGLAFLAYLLVSVVHVVNIITWWLT